MIRDQSLGIKGGFFISSLRLTEIVKKARLLGSKDIHSKKGVRFSDIVGSWLEITRTGGPGPCPPFLGIYPFPYSSL